MNIHDNRECFEGEPLVITGQGEYARDDSRAGFGAVLFVVASAIGIVALFAALLWRVFA